MSDFLGKTRFGVIGLFLAVITWLQVSDAEASSTVRSFAQRHQATGRVDSVLIGNQLLNCPPAASGCSAARDGTGNNNSFMMGQVDVDSDATTFNSSRAPLSIPVGSTVLRAYLYWGADTSGGSGGSAAPTAANRNQIRFSAAGGAYTTVTATTVDLTGTRYSAIADVTSIVAAAGNGTYAGANVQAGTGQDRYAGWSLVVIYSNPSLPLRSLTLFDGSLNINTTAPNSITTTVSGFRTPATGAVDARIGLIAFEGDNGFTGDQFLVNGTNISDTLNPSNNIFNSTNSRFGAAQTGRNPQQTNMFGFDIDYIPVAAGVIANNDTSASLTFTTTNETYYPIALLFQTNVYEPDIVTNFSKAALDINGGQYRPGDIVEYTIALSNTGDDASDQTVITDPLPVGLTYVPGSMQILTGPNAGAKTDAAGDDQAEYNAGTRTLTIRVGVGANATVGGRINPVPQPNSATSVRFRAQIDAVQTNGSTLANIANIAYIGVTSGTPSSGSTTPVTVTVARDADLAITKTGPATVVAGGAMQYLVTVNSLGPDNADGATVTDNVPAGITGVSITCAATGGAVCPATAGLTTLSALAIPTMPSGGQVVFTISGTAPAAPTTLNNSASVAPPAGTNDPTPGNNSAGPVATSVVAPNLDLSVAGTLTTAGTIRTGDVVTYEFTITNAGPAPANGAPFSLPMPSGLAGGNWGCAPAARCSAASGAGDVSVSLTLGVGESVTITVAGTAPATTPSTIGAATGTVSAPAGANDTNAGNNSATVPAITVQARAIAGADDTGSVASGAAGGTAVANVLVNDTLGGGPATLANVTLSQVSSTNPNVAINPGSGAVNVAPGTAAGTYTVVYQLCETSNPGNCAQATVTVTVGTATLVTVDDSGSVASGAAGGTAVANVLANDTLDGNPVTLADVVLTQVSTTHPNVTLDPATGAINVAPGTPAGSYTVVYQICEALNPANCATASVTVTVVAGVITAVDDSGSVASGAAGGTAVANVLANDMLDGNPATLANINLTQVSTDNANVTLDVASGAVNVAAGTPAGTYTVVYQICSQLNPTNCDTASVTVTVAAAALVAQADTGTVVSGAAGGTAVANVLANDTLGGNPATLADVALAQVSTDNPNVTLDVATGAVNVAPGTPAGSYTVVYQVCEILNPANCSTASVTVTVGAAAIDAVDDTGSLASGAAGGTAVADVLANDTYDGAPATLGNVTLTQVSTDNPNVTLDVATGAVGVAAGTAAGTYTVVYQICGILNPANCDTASVTVTVGAAALVAGADSGTVGSGAAGGTAVANVLANDTLGGAPATLANVTLTQVSTDNPNVTLDVATGAVNVAAGTPAGTYTVVYQICEILNPTNCATASVTVTVGAAAIDAVDDSGSVASGAAGGTAVANVLGNDTLGANPATLGNVSLTQVSTSNPNVTLDVATGAVNVAAGTPAGTYTVAYQICEILNPTNCDTAVATVTVGAAVLVANADSGSVTSGAAGGTAVANVLANDTLDGNPATLANVSLTQVSTDNPNVTLDPATGAVNVAAGTPAGTYTVVYQICEVLNPTNCDSASVTVTVGAAAIDAVDDTGTVASGAAGGTAVANVLANDTLDGNPVTLADVSLAQVSTDNPNVSLDVATGAINVAAGTPVGTYTVVYQLCEVLNPTNCDLASVTVTVGAAALVATADSGLVSSGAAGGTAVANVLANDTLDGNPATLANVTLTQISTDNPNVTLDVATGTVNVAPGTPAGTYTVVYQVCENLNPTNCDTASVTITVGAAVIDAVDDSGSVASGAAGGTAVANVLANDTLDGNPATLANVTLTQVSTDNPNVTLDVATGAVNVAPGTAAGTYTVEYQICEILNPTNCDTASVTVTVGAAAIDAADDTGSVASGAAGGTAVANVLANDTLDGSPASLANVTLTQVSTDNPNVTLDVATGAVNVAAGTPAGTYTVVYQICEILNPTNCETASVTVTVGAAVIDAVDDTGTVASGAAGGTAVANVLANDTLDGNPATLANVSLTQVSTTNPNVTLDVATGTVNVALGTAAGTYSVVYQICEVLNPTNCDSASVTVTVGAAVIDAVDDAGAVASGAAGGTAVANVLTNDTLDGAPATLANVSLTQVSTDNPNVTLDVATGSVVVAAGTPAGTYTVVYQICENLNPANCDTASATITVGAAVIDAVADTGSVASGAVGGTAVANVLANDTLDGNPATLANVSLTQVSTTNPNVTLDVATGSVVVAAGTPAGTYTVIYQICEVLNPTNCDSASVTITVGAAVIDAVADAGSVASGAAGGTAVASVLANDTLDGAPATLANVSLTQVSTDNPNVTLDPATGAVNVAAGTPAGTYTVVYQICEILNPTSCDTASVTVTVGAAVIDAVDDTGTVASGAAGGTAVANVLANDTLGGTPATIANVSLTQVSTDNPNVTLDPATGAVSIAAGTPAGTYTVVYQICEVLNPTNCDTASVTVTVGAAAIDAVDDAGSVASGAAGGTAVANVLANDTLDGNPATLANVTLTQVSTDNPNVALDVATGAINVAAGTPAGTYTVVYQICEILNPTNCDSASVTVTVGAAALIATADSGAVTSGAAGGTAVANVLANDTLDGSPATLANVSLTQVSTSNPNVTLDPATGAVNVAPGTPAGTYTVVYQICEILNPVNCDTASVTVTVGAAVIDAVDDTGTVASGATGGTAVANVLANDTLGGAPATLADVSLTQISTDNPNVTLDVATGAVNVLAGTPAGTYTVEYQICEILNPTNCDSASVTVTVGAAVLVATADSGSVASGAAGGTAVANVLANDTLDGNPATLANVSLTQVSTTNPNVTLDVATGAVNVAPGTPAGTYTVEYQICEILNPTNCGTASVTVTVGAAVIDAVADTGAVASGAAGGTAVANVLANDTLGGAPATLADVTLTQVSTDNPNVTLDVATGAVNVAAGTPAGTYTVVYQICEILNPTNCDSASVTVTVGAAVIDAVDDTGSVASGAAGGTAVASVLANDTLDGAPAILANVSLTQVSTTNPNVTLDVATGAVNVAPGTPAGTYTVEYQICEILNPTNCGTASVTVTVGAAVIDAVADTGSVASGAAGGTAVANVLANDALDGNPATLANVTLTQVSTDNPNVALDVATGAINVAAGTPAGTYTVVYQICEILNPTNCDTASVTVTVGAAVVDAVADTGSVASGAAGGTAVANVLANDTLDGNPVTLANVSLTQVSTDNPNVTLDPATGTVNVAAGTPAGTYTVVYQICEILNPTNCDTASVTVTVGAAVVDAVADTGSVASGAAGGTAVANVLANDTLDGNPATLANVTLTQVSTDNPNVTLDVATGAVNVAAGTPAGTYTVVYQICEVLNPTNCDSASVTVTVGAAVIDAVADTGSVASGAAGGTAVANVLANDTLDGSPATLGNVSLTQVSTSNPNVTLDVATGAVNVAAGTPAGTYTVVYQTCEVLNPTNCDTASVTVTVGAAVIDAVDDTGSVASGAAGGAAVASVLANDTLDGAPATLANVSLTQVSTTNPNVTLDVATGAVNVAAGTPAGTYTVVYQTCEVLNPTNCDTASVTVTVGAAVIDAVHDTGSVASGAAGGTAVANVLANDTLDGAPATLANVSLTQVSTTNPNVTLDVATGAVNVAAGTPAGTYTVVYQTCEVLNPTNCDTASVTVTVGAAVIDAVDDAGSVASGAAGGTAVPNVLANDTLDGNPATLANVTLTQVSTDNPNVTLDATTGAVNVAPGTPAGTYTVVYQICEVLNPANCDSASVTVTVGAAVIDAVDDTGSVASGAAGGTAVANVLANDTLDGNPATLANVALTQVSTDNPNVALDLATGAISVAAGTPAGTYTVVYQICEVLNPTNCDTASVTVTVGAAVIDAVDDTGSVASGAAGGTAVANVLANDTLDGNSATLANVNLTQVSTDNPNVTLDVATGAVHVAPGTPAGTYTVVYQICELLNPTNCDTATVTVTVGAAVIDAVDDTGTVASGAAGGTAVANVLANDTLDGNPATLANVTLTQVSTDNPNVTLDVATGAVNVAPGTPAGTYTVVYQICEILNPTNCDTASVTVTVGAAVIDAVDDTGAVASGAAGGTAVANVLANDTLDGAPATLANVTLTQVSTDNPNVTLDPATGAVNVAAGTPAGTYTVVYQICENLNPANCDTASVTITVGAAVIDAVDDTGSVASGAAGGTAVANVLANDTLDGAPATLANVSLTQVSTDNPNVTLDVATGAVNVAPGTPAGTYTVVYQICELLNPTSCDTATVTVTVGAATIDAVDDTGSVASGAAGGTAVANVLANDTLDGNPATLANVSLTQVSTTHPNVTLDVATGAVNVAPGTPAGTYTLVYQICEILNPANCDTASVTVTVGAAVIDARVDIGTVESASAGGIAVPNVLVNDTLGGAPATLANVVITQLSTTSPNVTLDPATGAVHVAPGTPMGVYIVEYRICEILNPTNCDIDTARIVITEPIIDAVDDAGTVASDSGGVAVANVLGNDTLEGAPAALATVSLVQVSTSHPGVQLDVATGAVNVAAGTPAGTYTLVYRICERLNPTNCDQATVVVTVTAPPPPPPPPPPVLDAVDDAGETGQNTPVTIAILDNDGFGTGPATIGVVTVTIVSGPTHGTAVVNPDGSITYTPGENFSGTDQLRYRICSITAPDVCDEAVVTIVVAPGVVIAPDDEETISQGSSVGFPLLGQSSSTGAPLDPSSLVVVTPPAHGTVVINPDGSATYTPDPDFFGTDSFTYRICDTSVPTPVCDTGTITIIVEKVAPELRLTKTTPAVRVQVGDYVRYRLVVENIGPVAARNLTVLDTPPAGFTYVEDSLGVVDGDGLHGLAGTQPLRITGVDIPVGGSATITYLLRVGAGIGPGMHTNTAMVYDDAGLSVSNQAKADVVVEGDAMLEESLLLGTVFVDTNGDGRQQPGEPGLAGVRLATVEGLVIETDVHGRYHLVGMDGGNALRGRNVIVKVDAATLPPGSRFTTPNPLVRRVTPGIPVRFDFGVQLPEAGSDTAPEMR